MAKGIPEPLRKPQFFRSSTGLLHLCWLEARYDSGVFHSVCGHTCGTPTLQAKLQWMKYAVARCVWCNRPEVAYNKYNRSRLHEEILTREGVVALTSFQSPWGAWDWLERVLSWRVEHERSQDRVRRALDLLERHERGELESSAEPPEEWGV